MSTTDVKCKYCCKEFSKRIYCKRHIENVHKRNARGEVIPEIARSKFICVLCDKQFGLKDSLRRHIEAIHSSHTDSSKPHECTKCDFKTVYRKNLERHILKIHNTSRDNSKPFKAIFKCSLCSAKFSCRKNLMYHERKTHQLGQLARVVKRKCPICAFTAYGNSKHDMHSHFENIHEICMKWEHHNFNSITDFNDWKQDTEKKTTSSFIRTRTKTNFLTYQCHRNGTYKYQGNNKRSLKVVGSCKINGFCPAIMKVNILENDGVSVLYLPTHVGHKNEVKHLRPKDRRSIETLLGNETPCQIISKANSDANDMSRHICLVTQALNESHSKPMSNDNDNETHLLIVDVPDNQVVLIEEGIFSGVNVVEENVCVETQKNELFREFQEIWNNITTLQQVEYVRQHLKQISPSFDTMNMPAEQTIKVICDVETPANITAHGCLMSTGTQEQC